MIDDGSSTPVDNADFRFEKSRGIVAAKNKSLELLMDAGVEHLFLWDDDAWPIADGWWKPYVDSPEPHLSYQFLDLAGPRKLRDIAEVYRDDKHVAYTGQRGLMLYYHRSAVEKVGGFDPVYGRGMYEHSDLANRIHHAGLTTWRYADVAGSEKLIYSLDEHQAVERSVPLADRQELTKRNAEIHNRRRDEGYFAHVPYRDPVDVVITTLLTSQPDPQRAKKWKAEASTLKAWADSINGARAVVLADELESSPSGAVLERVPAVDMNVYMRRWLHIYQHLREHPEYRYVWATDGSDVEMLHAPWDEMEPGKVYVGSEPKTYDDEWALKHHPAGRYQEFLKAHRRDPMLNAGLLGGTRDDVMAFAHGIVQLYYDLEAQRFWGTDPAPAAIGDMIAFGIVAHERFGDRVVTGPGVHTAFRAEERTPWAWWKHR